MPRAVMARSGVPQPIPELDILWITAGLGCDGETIALTGATQPSLEDLVLGAMPWIAKINFRNPLLAPENGDDFLKAFHRAADGGLAPFILVVEGSVPNEQNKSEGYWAALGTDPVSGQPITTCEWIDRLAPRAWAVMAVGTRGAAGASPRTPSARGGRPRRDPCGSERSSRGRPHAHSLRGESRSGRSRRDSRRGTGAIARLSACRDQGRWGRARLAARPSGRAP
jgi:NADH ubiquinone oxidoreductase, 20 Kd subunit